MINTDDFVQEMDDHWTQRLGNVSSDNLRRVWRQIGEQFSTHVHNHNSTEKRTKWTVLQPPTGSGKSEGTAVYCSMLSRLQPEQHPGVLIVTRLIDDAEYMASRINELSKKDVAVAYHSGSKSRYPLETLKDWPVVVITHRAYEIALDILGSDSSIEGTWSYFHSFNPEASSEGLQYFADDNDRRKLVIVDESLDIVEHNQVTLDELRRTLGAIPQTIRTKHQKEINIIEAVIDRIDYLDRKYAEKVTPELMIQRTKSRTELIAFDKVPNLSELRASLKDIRFDHQSGKNDLNENQRLRKGHDDVLRSLHNLFRQWAYYAKTHSKHTFNTARLLIPENVKGAVVLDATASSNVMYEILENAEVIVPPPNSRTYQNVRLHISRGHKVGKRHLFNHAKKTSENLIASLNERLEGNRAFICCHKGVEPLLSSYDPTFEMHTGHWGAVDGSNQWKDCDAAVIFGLPYMPDTWAPNVFMASQGPQTTQWLRDSAARAFKKHDDIREALKAGQMAVSVVQAINRVQCRRVVDADGNCPVTDVYLMLPSGSLADRLLDRIKAEMPGIRVMEDWELDAAKRKARRSNHETSLAKFFETMEVGRIAAGAVARRLGISSATFSRLKKKIKDDSSELYSSMAAAGVQLISQGNGNRQYFLKGV